MFSYIWVTLLLLMLWVFDVSTLLTPYITPLSQYIILVWYLRAQLKWNYRGRVSYREENWEKKTYSRMSFKTVWFFPIWLLFCWLASDNTWYIISYLYLAQLLIGINFPRIEYRMTKDTPEGWALREYARKEFNEEKEEKWLYAQLYAPHLRNKTHEYYWWWRMQGENWIFRIKAFSQFTRDILACIVIPVITIPCTLFTLWVDLYHNQDAFSMEGIDYLTDIFIPVLIVLHIAFIYLFDNYTHRYYAWNYFFYYERYIRHAAKLDTKGIPVNPGEPYLREVEIYTGCPRIENPGTWGYYYYILRGVFPWEYRDLQNQLDAQRRHEEGRHWLDDENDDDEVATGEDDLIGAGEGDLDDYDAVGGIDYSDDYVNPNEEEAQNEDEEAYSGGNSYTQADADRDAEKQYKKWEEEWVQKKKEEKLKQQKEQEEDRKFQEWKEKKKKS